MATQLEASIRRLFHEAFGSTPDRIDAMQGGASSRKFFRASQEALGRTAVAIYVPDAARPDEIAKVSEHDRRWPFLEVRDLLEDRGIKVPKLLGENCDEGLILVEDLGDDTLAAALQKRPELRVQLYRQAVVDLADAQQRLRTLPADSIVRERAFDRDLLEWEVHHFREWALEARGVSLGSSDRRVFDQAASYLASLIASWPAGFVHRDYQSRNLMVRWLTNDLDAPGFELVWIDFQDALLGPRVYDLVALLGDSYQSFTPEFVQDRLDDFADAACLSAEERVELDRQLAFVTVQRKLKDAGRFVYIDRNKEDSSFLQFVDPTVRKVHAALERLHDVELLQDLGDVLRRALPDAV